MKSDLTARVFLDVLSRRWKLLLLVSVGFGALLGGVALVRNYARRDLLNRPGFEYLELVIQRDAKGSVWIVTGQEANQGRFPGQNVGALDIGLKTDYGNFVTVSGGRRVPLLISQKADAVVLRFVEHADGRVERTRSLLKDKSVSDAIIEYSRRTGALAGVDVAFRTSEPRVVWASVADYLTAKRWVGLFGTAAIAMIGIGLETTVVSRRSKSNCCVKCGYSLAGMAPGSGLCPECGDATD